MILVNPFLIACLSSQQVKIRLSKRKQPNPLSLAGAQGTFNHPLALGFLFLDPLWLPCGFLHSLLHQQGVPLLNSHKSSEAPARQFSSQSGTTLFLGAKRAKLRNRKRLKRTHPTLPWLRYMLVGERVVAIGLVAGAPNTPLPLRSMLVWSCFVKVICLWSDNAYLRRTFCNLARNSLLDALWRRRPFCKETMTRASPFHADPCVDWVSAPHYALTGSWKRLE